MRVRRVALVALVCAGVAALAGAWPAAAETRAGAATPFG